MTSRDASASDELPLCEAAASGFLEVREARPEDVAELVALERLSAEQGRFGPFKMGLATEVHGPFFASGRHYERWRSFVALDRQRRRIAGLICYGVKTVQVNGAPRPGAYLFRLRVHPDYRRRGVGAALFERAVTRSRGLEGASVAWAALLGGNEPSYRTVRRAPRFHARRFVCRIARPASRAPALPRGLRVRSAISDDATAVATLQNTYYADHQLWAPRDLGLPPAELVESLAGDDGDVYLIEDVRGRPRACATVSYLARSMEMRVVGLPLALRVVNRLVQALPVWLRPLPDLRESIRLACVIDLAFPPSAQEEAAALVDWLSWVAGREADLVAVGVDPISPEWAVLRQVRGMPYHIVLAASSAEPLDAERPWYYALR